MALNAATDLAWSPETPVRPIARQTLDEQLYLVGHTYWDMQHNGTAGKSIAVDYEGFVQTVWTKLEAPGNSSPRHVYYNYWSPEFAQFMLPEPDNAIGVPVDNAPRAGYCTIGVNRQGFGFPVFHQTSPSRPNEPHAAGGHDFLPRTGAFRVTEIPYLTGRPQIIWPKVDVDVEGNLQTVHTESGGSSLDYYAKGFPLYNDQGEGDSIRWDDFVGWEPASFITMDVSASLRTQKVAVAWLAEPRGLCNEKDAYVRISHDGGATWDPVINITNLSPIDTECVRNGGSIEECNGDTMRPWLDLSVLIDECDVVHVAFTTHAWFYWDESGETRECGWGFVYSNIWHWDEVCRQYNIVAERWYGPAAFLGVNNLMCQRPSLAVDTTTGWLYCSFQAFDSVQSSQGGYAQADVYVTVSTDRGHTWAEATNVTNTDGGTETPAGECMHERDISLAKYVANGRLHLLYQLDRDAGTAIATTPEGTFTNNEIYYMSIPTDSIPTEPIVNPFRALRVDSTGYPFEPCSTWSPCLLSTPESNPRVPMEFALAQNYPNPFNSLTTITYTLPRAGVVSLLVFNVLGQEVVLVNREIKSAGTYQVRFDGSNLATGIYFYTLTTPSFTATRKMLLLK